MTRTVPLVGVNIYNLFTYTNVLDTWDHLNLLSNGPRGKGGDMLLLRNERVEILL